MRKKTIIIGLVTLGIAGAGMQFFAGSGVVTQPPATYFAHVDKNGVVDNVIVATQAFIDSGRKGVPSEWVQTSMDGSVSEGYAGKGLVLKKDTVTGKNSFIDPKAAPTATYDLTTNSWSPSVTVDMSSIATTTPL